MTVSATIAAVRIAYGLWLDLYIRGADYKQNSQLFIQLITFVKTAVFSYAI